MSFNRRPVIRLFVVLAATALLPTWAHAQIPVERTAPLVVRDFRSELACGVRATATRRLRLCASETAVNTARPSSVPAIAVIVRGGTSQGLRVGQDYFVRRVTDDRFTEPASDRVPTSAFTPRAGSGSSRRRPKRRSRRSPTRATASRRETTSSPSSFRRSRPRPQARACPDFAHPGRLILGDDRRQMGATGDFMVFDRGSDHGLRNGQRLTIFRRTAGGSARSLASAKRPRCSSAPRRPWSGSTSRSTRSTSVTWSRFTGESQRR